MSLDRFYNTWDMGHIPDDVATYDGTFFYTYSNAPSWFETEQISPGRFFPSFSFTPPQGTAGTFTITVVEFFSSTGLLNSSGTITINLQAFVEPPWVIDFCFTTMLVWLDPSGGFESYTFSGKQQLFQDQGNSATYINSESEKRFHRKDEIHQGVVVTTGKITPVHSDFIADLFKSIQAFLVFEDGSVPINIEPRPFNKVRSGESFAQYEFEFRQAVEDVIQTQ